jgi:integrase
MNKAQQQHYQSLYQQHLKALRRQGKSKSTIDIYSRAVRRVTEFFDRSPDRLSTDDLKEYFSNLVETHSWSTVKVDRCGLQFFYQHVLGKDWQWVDIVKPPQVKSLPDILTTDEVSLIINSTRELRYQTYILTVYSMGLRLGEALRLRIGDIDGQRHRVHVRNSKGRKDRLVTLPQATLLALRKYWSTHRHPSLLFPAGTTPDERGRAEGAMNPSGLQKSIKTIVRSCGIHKQITTRSLRHTYGAHLVEAGLNLRAIQQQMGHVNPTTTAIYTQLTESAQQHADDMINAIIDRLCISLDGEV